MDRTGIEPASFTGTCWSRIQVPPLATSVYKTVTVAGRTGNLVEGTGNAPVVSRTPSERIAFFLTFENLVYALEAYLVRYLSKISGSIFLACPSSSRHCLCPMSLL